MKIPLLPLAAAMAAGLAGAASAHVVVLPATAPPGSAPTLKFVVGHGCSGAATTALRVEFPTGVSGVTPEAKDGWKLDVERRGGRVVAATWRGELAPHQSDSFQANVHAPAKPGRLEFATVQTCGDQSVRWADPAPEGSPKPAHPAPSLTLVAAQSTTSTPAAAVKTPKGIQALADGFADATGRPLYTFDFDTMVGMSHCEGDCAKMWPPLIAAKDAKPFGDWTLVTREDGSRQWAYKTKPLYTYEKDQPGGPAQGLAASNWKRAK